ncbi:MAG: PPC domain-containing protein [Verrucomicrobia bacterium]|nr:PPC domain-containing protein [Verrucomicrobiota bacterium]
MNLRLTLMVLPWLAVAVSAQENTRQLEGPGSATKYLTPGQLDCWTFDGDQGETIAAWVATREFDPILELTLKGDKADQVVVPEVDDDGSESRFSVRLPANGRYSIRVHAFKFQGGGNYSLEVQRFQAKPVSVGKPFTGTLDHDGKAYCYVPCLKDRFLVPELKATPADAWQVRDSKGRDLTRWAGTVHTEEAGEHTLIVSGRPDQGFDLLLRDARCQDLTAGQAVTGRLQQGEMDVWSFQAKPGDFRMLEVAEQGALTTRLIHAPPEKRTGQHLARPGERPEIQFLPVASQRSHLRFAAWCGREGRYQLHLVAGSPVTYNLTMSDPTLTLEPAKETTGNLPVGGALFYSFQATPGQLLHADLVSPQFVPLLRLYDPAGHPVEPNTTPDSLHTRVTHMVLAAGRYRIQVASLGDGGGGEFRLTLDEEQLKSVAIDGREHGTLQPNITDFWAFEGPAGKTVFISVRAADCEPAVNIRSPEGVSLASDKGSGDTNDRLLAVKLPKTGRYTLAISSRRGAGDYTLRLIDGD